MPQWIIDYGTEIGAIVMAFISGIAAYLKNWETANVEWTTQKHVLKLAMFQFYAAFAALLVWHLIRVMASYGYPLPEPAIPLLMGIAGYNGVRVVDIFTTTGIDWIRKRLGLAVEAK